MKKLVIVLILLAGVGLLSYPIISNYISEKNGSSAIQELKTEVADTNKSEIDKQRKLAEEYNSNLNGENIKDPFVPDSGTVRQDNYNDILDFSNHMMGYIEIPKIGIYLPIYHGTSDDVLSKGIGHMSETAFPIGGKRNHAVLTGHTGLANAKLFTDLTKLQEDDVFYIHILEDTLAYKVDQIKVVVPEDTSDLLPVQGEDYVTLITCTPYAVNSHRLLVRGTRIPYTNEQHEEEMKKDTIINKIDVRMILYGAVTAVIMLIVTAIVLFIRSKRSRR